MRLLGSKPMSALVLVYDADTGPTLIFHHGWSVFVFENTMPRYVDQRNRERK
jgi:hypothetical protein